MTEKPLWNLLDNTAPIIVQKKIIALHHEISKKYVSKLQTMFNQLVNQQVFFKIVASYLIQKFEY